MCSVSGNHGPPPATPTDDIDVITPESGSYSLNISNPEVAYIVQLVTNATSTTTYFLILPVSNTGGLASYCIYVGNTVLDFCVWHLQRQI